RRAPRARVLRGEPPHEPPDLDLGEGRRQFRLFPDLSRNRREQRLDRGRADGPQHLGAVRVRDREELHFSFSSAATYSAYCSAVMSLATSWSVESLTLISPPSPKGSSLTIPGSSTAALFTSTTSPETGAKSSETAL